MKPGYNSAPTCTVLFFLILGTEVYSAKNHVILTNVVAWSKVSLIVGNINNDFYTKVIIKKHKKDLEKISNHKNDWLRIRIIVLRI